MNKKHPAISVVMPAYNAELFIEEAINSILNQSFKDFELIIIDDRSKDSTWSVIQHFAKKDKRIIPIRNSQNLKLSKSLNKGIKVAKGKYIARMDADDWSYPDRLKKQYIFMEKHPFVVILGGTMELIDRNGKKLGTRRYTCDDAQIRKKMFFYSPFSHPLVIIRKTILDKAGYYNHDFNPAEDYELYFRLGMFGAFANLADTLLKYRIVEKSMTTGTTRKMELKTIAIRNIYSKHSEYPMGIVDRLYTLLQLISVYIIPPSVKINIFNFSGILINKMNRIIFKF